jgi:site-specific recombinase XerD
VLLSLVYRLVRCLFGLVAVLARSDLSKDAELLVLRHENQVLRHSLAVHLLRSGETLKGIGDLLGHRRPDTTFIYTKLAVEDLRRVALDPAEVS